MCGIVGFFNRKENINADPISGMVDIIRHRGPNDDGIEKLSMFNKSLKENVIAGFVRLSIRDLSMKGHQPMFNDDKSIMITFNGEIYNADEIRDELKAEGITFHSTCDTEVIIKHYEKYGIEKTIEKMNGMFGIALYDLKEDCIFLIRDRLGEKPLYYYQNNNVFMFASEYKAFYAHPAFKPELNENGIDEYCLYRYVSDNETLLKGVYCVRPGSYLKITSEDIQEYIYYNIPGYGVKKTKISDKQFEDAVVKSVKSRLVSDVEVGVQLSGGVDSSIAMHIANHGNGKIKSFSMIFDNPEYSEEEYIRKVLEVSGGEPYMYKMPKVDYLEALKETTWNFEAPVNHHGSVQLHYLCKSAQEKVNVILTGEGADELLGGYSWYPASMFCNSSKLVWRIRTLSHKIRHKDNMYWEDKQNYTDEEKFILADSQTPPCLIEGLRPQLNYKSVLDKRKKMYYSCNGMGVEKKLNYEMKTFMVDLLMRQDKVSMASSIECRVPFVDQDFIEFVRANVSVSDMVRRQSFGRKKQNTKLILKRLAAKYFGDDFAYRKKMGLPSPLAEYFYEPEFRDYMQNVILPNVKKRNIFNYDYVKECYEEKKNLTNVVWRALTFEIWAMMYLDNDGRNVLEYAKS